MLDREMIEELMARLADRYTASELVDLLDISVEDIIEEYIHLILKRPELIDEAGFQHEEETE